MQSPQNQCLLVLGAGASFGSDSTNTPPLGKDLFYELTKFDPNGWGELDISTANQFVEDFEGGVISIGSDSSQHLLPVLQRSMAAFFFRYIPSSQSLYLKLARKIKLNNWQGSIATFNYERMLQICLLHVGLQPNLNMGPSNSSMIEICMPHGCCNLFCEGVKASSSGVSFSPFGVETNGPVVSVSDFNEFNDRIKNDAFPPVMSYFEPKKRTTSGANFISGQRKRFAELCNQAKKIVVVGLKPRFHDIHIWNPLAETSAEIVYCGGGDSGEFLNWSKKSHRAVDKALEGYFEDQFDKICLELFN